MAKTYSFVVADPVGLHARPATVLVQAANKCACDVKLEYNGREVNLKSIMGILSLGVPTQASVTITCDGADEDKAIEFIEETCKTQKVCA